MYKYSVLTCLFGRYDNLWEIQDKRDDVEYICVTDDDELTSDTWTIKKADDFILSLPFINQWTYIRYHPFEFVTSDICFYIDGSIEIVKDFTEVLMNPFINSNKEYGTLIHPWRSNISEETSYWVNYKKYKTQSPVYEWLTKNNYKVNGLLQSTVILQKNTRMTNMINNRTWELCHQWTNSTEIDRNNQCDLTYVINTLFYDDDRFMPLSPQVICSDYMHWRMHATGDYWGWDGYNSATVFDKENYGLSI